MNTTLSDVVSFIHSPEFSSSDHDQIVAALKASAKIRSQNAKRQFNVGDEVEFVSNKRRSAVRGTVTKITRSKVLVVERDGGFPGCMWSVSPSLLKKVCSGSSET